jgi:hypothetical protein
MAQYFARYGHNIFIISVSLPCGRSSMMYARMPQDQQRLVPKIAWRRLIDLVRTGR